LSFKTLEQDGRATTDIGTDPEDLCTEVHGNGTDVEEITKDGDGLGTTDGTIRHAMGVASLERESRGVLEHRGFEGA